MAKVADRYKQRWNYVRAKRLFALLAAGVVVIGAGAFLTAVIMLILFAGHPSAMSVILYLAGFGLLYSVTLVIPVSVIYLFKKVSKKAASIPYVPPVQKQLLSLPAKEVLLRGSQVTAAARDELLRPSANQETAKDELLRVTNEIERER